MSRTNEAESLFLSEEGDTQCKMSRGEDQKQVNWFPSAQVWILKESVFLLDNVTYLKFKNKKANMYPSDHSRLY